MNENKKLRWIFVAIAIVMLFSALFSLPVWQSTTHHDLMAERHKLESKLERLHDRELLLNVPIHAIASIEFLERAAKDNLNLSYNGFPVQVRLN